MENPSQIKPLDPSYPGQPERCYVVVNGGTVGVGVVTRGFRGYSPVYDYTRNVAALGRETVLALAQEVVDRYNTALGLSRGVAMACQIGSMVGWSVPGADPRRWNPDGTPADRAA